MRHVLRTPDRTVTRCLVCGSNEVRTDEVVDRGFLFLHECPHCDHRWTRRQEPAPARVTSIAAGEVAHAA